MKLSNPAAARSMAAWLFVLFMAITPAAADDAAHAAAKELVDFTMGRMLSDTLAKMSGAMWPGIQASLPKTVDDKTLADLHVEFDRVTQKYVAESLKVAPDIYAQHFTADELRQLLAFYKTPLGGKVLTEVPKVMAEYATKALLPMMPAMQAELRDSIEAVLRSHGVAR